LTTIQSDPTFGSESLGAALMDADTEIGTLLNTEDCGLELYLVFPYQSISAYSTLYAGYHFFTAVAPKVIWNRLGTQPARVHVSFHCIREFDAETKNFKLGNDDIGPAEGVI
jgi:hypothetical protein